MQSKRQRQHSRAAPRTPCPQRDAGHTAAEGWGTNPNQPPHHICGAGSCNKCKSFKTGLPESRPADDTEAQYIRH
eukprot:702681-Pyramimonas_sp.AAC.1